jgi:hypothetical protein
MGLERHRNYLPSKHWGVGKKRLLGEASKRLGFINWLPWMAGGVVRATSGKHELNLIKVGFNSKNNIYSINRRSLSIHHMVELYRRPFMSEMTHDAQVLEQICACGYLATIAPVYKVGALTP